MPARGRAPDRATAPSAACPGASPSRPTTSRDLELTYQYSNFGVPGLGLERGLSEDLVVAPYATALAAMVDPAAAARNFDALAAVGGARALRLLRGARLHAVAAAGRRDGGDRARLHGAPPGHDARRARQRAPRRRDARALPRRADRPGHRAAPAGARRRATSRSRARAPRRCDAPAHVREFVAPVFRRFTSPHEPAPRTHLLSNGRYAVMLTAAGSGYSRWRDLAVTRWREDVTRDPWGTYVFLRDVAERRGLVGRVPADRRRARPLRGDVLRGPRRVRSARRHDRDHARGGRLARGRRRGPPRLGHEPRRRGRARSS